MTKIPCTPAALAHMLLNVCRAGLPTLLLMLTLLAGVSSAQQTAPTDAMTPTGLAPGAPAGSYALSDIDNINLFNGNLNFRLPLLKIGGRGSAGYTMMLPIEQKWIIKSGQTNPYTGVTPQTPNPNWWQGIKPGYGPGVLQGRRSGYGEWPYENYCGTTPNVWEQTLTRLTFTAADGTEYELRDTLTGGAPSSVANVSCSSQGASRGTVFVTADGSAATFISDSTIYDYKYLNASIDYRLFYPSGYLILRDGTRYRIDSGQVSWIRDRNGNKVTFGGSAFVTDSMNRQVSVTAATSSTPYDQISFNGYGGAARTIKVYSDTLGNRLRSTGDSTFSTYALKTYYQLFPLNSASTTSQYNPSRISAVELPNGKSYQFYYNPYGELARVVLPTGGAIEYDWAGGAYDADGVIFRYVAERRVYSDGSTLESKTVYTRTDDGISPSTVTVDTKDANGVLLAESKHYFYSDAYTSMVPDPAMPSAISYSPWKQGREYKTESFDVVSGTASIRQRIEQAWAQRASISWWSGTSDNSPANDPRLTESITTLTDTNQVAKQTYSYDQYNNKTDVYEYDYGSGTTGSLVRRTNTDYLTTNTVGGVSYNYATDTSIHLRGLPSTQKIYNASGVEQARTTYEYDNYTATSNHAGLVSRYLISGLDSGFTTSYLTRGNATAVTRSLLTNGSVTSSIAAYSQYDIAGNLVAAIDGRGYSTTIDYTDRFGSPDGNARLNSAPSALGSQSSYALPTKVTNALGQDVYAQYDYYLGRVVDGEDVNGVTSSGYYNDSLDRPTQIVRAASDTSLYSQTSFSYDDTNRIITSTSDLSSYGDNLIKGQTLYDGLGRTTEIRKYETSTNYITTKQIYDALGRAKQASNPYRSGDTVAYTTRAYDGLGRVKTVTTPDSAIATTSYSGNTTTVTDQAGKDRQTTIDALGRLTQAVEDPGTGGLGYSTTYTYDVLDNLTQVTQGSETRTFVYDSLKRLTSATNPESGTISYLYDNNGNLTRRTDARSIQTDYTYDALNRLTLRDYSDTTPDVNFYYDSQTLPSGAPTFTRGASIGRLVALTYGGTSAGSYYGFNGLGETLTRVQQTDSTNYVVDATYNKAGAMTTETYPSVPSGTSRRTVSYSFDNAGRLSSLSSAATNYAAAASISSISYAAHGALSSETLGNSLIHGLSYNSRLQPTQISLGASGTPTSILSLTYNYGTTNNNGNVLDVTNQVGTSTTKQIYTYDDLNRLSTTQETNGSTTTYWTQTNGYDRYGNRWEVIGGSPTLSFNTNNRITTSGYSYDSAGNLTTDGSHTYTFDAENRITTVDSANAYKYDGEGRRVRKFLGENLRFIYDISGQLIAEFDGSTGAISKEYVYGAGGLAATIEPTIGTRYTTGDHLGSPRVVTNSSGGVVSRHDYKPFGEELFAGIGGRTTTQGFSVNDSLRQKFTQYERDAETGLDYAQARYYSSPQGRFTTPDPLMRSASIGSPQTFNRYSYVLNNPLNVTDPTGLCPKGKKCYTEKDENGKEVEYYDDEDGNPVVVIDIDSTKGSNTAGVTVIERPPIITLPDSTPIIEEAPPSRIGTVLRGIGRIFGAIGIIILNPTTTGCGASPGMISDGHGRCVQKPSMSDEPDADAPANPDPEDNKPDTSENQTEDKGKKEKSSEAKENYRPLSKRDIKALQKAGHDIHEMKEGFGGPPKHFDLYKDRQGNVYVMRKGGRGEPYPTGVKLN